MDERNGDPPVGKTPTESDPIEGLARAFFDCGSIVPVSDDRWKKCCKLYRSGPERASWAVIVAFRSARLAVDLSEKASPSEAPPAENLRLVREQAAVYREMAPLLDRLHKLASRRGWPLGRNILQCAVEELERMTPSTTARLLSAGSEQWLVDGQLYREVSDADLPDSFGHPALKDLRCACTNGFVGVMSIESAFLHKPRLWPQCFPDGNDGGASCRALTLRRVALS